MKETATTYKRNPLVRHSTEGLACRGVVDGMTRDEDATTGEWVELCSIRAKGRLASRSKRSDISRDRCFGILKEHLRSDGRVLLRSTKSPGRRWSLHSLNSNGSTSPRGRWGLVMAIARSSVVDDH